MPESNVPAPLNGHRPAVHDGAHLMADLTAPRHFPAPAEPEGVPWGRYLDALRRGKWLILACLAAGTALGVAASRYIRPVYQAHATIWVSSTSEGRQQSGPIRAAELLQSRSWVELLRSFAIADSVVHKLRLYVVPQQLRDSLLFSEFHQGPRVTPGRYVLAIDSGAPRYELRDSENRVLERGTPGDSIGRALGFRWQPAAEMLLPGRTIEFAVSTPRDASMRLLENLQSTLPEDGQFLRMTMTGGDPERTARTLNTWTQQFVASATALKKHNLIEFRKILESQLEVAERELHNAEMELERFRVQTITLPSESGTIAGGVEATRAPVLENYFDRKMLYDNTKLDREALEAIVRRADGGPIPAEALFAIPGVVTGAPPLRAALDELTTRRAELRAAQRTYTDAHPRVRQLAEAVTVLERQTIPQLASEVLASLRDRERELEQRIAGASRELREIPARTIEEMRLRRQVSVAENLYNTLKARYEEAKLAEAGATPDLSILDMADPPQSPQSNRAPMVILLAIAGSLGAAIAAVLLFDRLDKRFRYPEQATKELGLTVLGAIPRLVTRRRGTDIESMTRLVEAFRALRISVRHALPSGGPMSVTVTSPGAGEGKSLIAANLAVSFANAGQRVILIDGDVRQGSLHRTFDIARGPGLVEYLAGAAELTGVVHPTQTRNLHLIGSGSRPARAPELLASDRLLELMGALRARYDVVIVDGPPLLAGSDAFALGVGTTNVLLVLRNGTSDRRLAEAKLQVLDRLPLRVLGAVLNGIEERGMYKYYGYSYAGSEPMRNEELTALAAPMTVRGR